MPDDEVARGFSAQDGGLFLPRTPYQGFALLRNKPFRVKPAQSYIVFNRHSVNVVVDFGNVPDIDMTIGKCCMWGSPKRVAIPA